MPLEVGNDYGLDDGMSNPHDYGWYELINEEYVLTEDTNIDYNKQYYKIAD